MTETKAEWNTEKIVWTEKTGHNGAYQTSEDCNNSDFKALLKDIEAHKGFIKKDGFNYWLFKNGLTIGRKRKF